MRELAERLLADPTSAAEDVDLAAHLHRILEVSLRAQRHHPRMKSEAVRPDPKPEPRLVNRDAGRAKLALETFCRCGCLELLGEGAVGRRLATDRAHLVGRDLGGDDVDDNLVPLAHSCHMAIEHREPGWEKRAARVRATLTLDEIDYVLRTKGQDYLDNYWPGGSE